MRGSTGALGRAVARERVDGRCCGDDNDDATGPAAAAAATGDASVMINPNSRSRCIMSSVTPAAWMRWNNPSSLTSLNELLSNNNRIRCRAEWSSMEVCASTLETLLGRDVV